MWTIVNDDMCRMTAVDNFTFPPRPVFSDVPEHVDDAVTFETEGQAAGFLADMSGFRTFDVCQIHNERPDRLFW